MSDLQEFAVIARPLRRTGPIPFAPFPPLAERTLMPATREPRDGRDTRTRSRWMPPLSPAQPLAVAAPAHPGSTWAVRPPSVPSANETTGPSGASAARSIPSDEPARPTRGGCHAVYHGQGTLSVLSSITGHHYRFEGKGCTLTIDPRDRLVLGRLSELSIHSASS